MADPGPSSGRPASPGGGAGSILKAKDGSLYVPSSVATPPPGFSFSDANLFHGRNISRSAAASAPPTSLFGTSLLFDGALDVEGDRERAPRIRQIPDLTLSSLGGGGGADGSSDPVFTKSRTMSYTNLANALGEGLAECMGDSLLNDSSKQRGLNLASLPRSSTSNANEVGMTATANELDNIDRQNRHSSRRRADAEPTYIDPQHMLQTTTNASSLSQHQEAHDLLSRRPLVPSSNHVASANGTARNGNGNVNGAVNGNGVGVVVVEPSNTPGLALNLPNGNGNGNGSALNKHTISSTANNRTDDLLSESTQKMLRLNSMLGHGRASAPPQLFLSQSGGLLPNNIFEEKQTILQNVGVPRVSGSTSASTSASGAIDSRTGRRGFEVTTDGRTPLPSFENSPGQFSMKLQAGSSASRSATPSSAGMGGGSTHSDQMDQALQELRPFVWESSSGNSRVKDMYPSRALAIFGLASLQLSEVRSTCEAFGSLLYFRAEFFYSKSLLLIAYHDLRSAHHAAGELRSYLRQMMNDVHVSAGAKDVKVLYSVSLISSFERDGSTLVISNLPSHATDQEVSDLLASTYGELRSVQSDRSGSLIVEFFDIQDAEQAVAEIQTAKPWGGQTSVSSKMRQDYERQKGKELLAIIGSWRQSSKQKNLQQPQKTSFQSQAPSESLSGNVFAHGQNIGRSSPEMSQDSKHSGVNTHSTAPSSVSPMMMQPTPQVVLGPDGQYSYVMVQHQPYPPPAVNQHYGAVPQQLPPGQQHVVSGPHGAYITNAYEGQGYWVQQPPHQHIPNPTVPQYLQASPNRGTIAHQPVVDMRHGQSVPMYTPTIAHNHAVVDSSVSSSNTNTSKRSPSRNKDENDNQHLALDIEIVKSGGDVRTSLMVRNIPNKYTQNMLLSEFTESGHGPGKLDFFYLPIDFRNKCNRGYAFINFVDYADIISFYDTYNGKQWKIFKSEKICCITYARIQGQDSMMKRFQNSALMEKDQEYRPLVFTSDGNIA